LINLTSEIGVAEGAVEKTAAEDPNPLLSYYYLEYAYLVIYCFFFFLIACEAFEFSISLMVWGSYMAHKNPEIRHNLGFA
jgi:hypothetical protein